MGYTKDLWTRPSRDDAGEVRRDKRGRVIREHNERWGNGKRWLACWDDGLSGTPPTQAFVNKENADNHWKRMEADVERGQYVAPAAGATTVSAIGARWLRTRDVDQATLRRYEQILRLHIEPSFGPRPVRSVLPSEVLEWQNEKKQTLGLGTMAVVRFQLVGVFALAMADKMIRENPALHSIVPRIVAKRGTPIEVWSEDRVHRVTDAFDEKLRLLPQLGATTGLRSGELIGLAVDDIDFDRRVIHVRRQIKQVCAGGAYAPPKGGKTRDVPLSGWTAQCIRTHMAKYAPLDTTLPWRSAAGEPETHRLLLHAKGRRLTAQTLSLTYWKPALCRAGVLPPPTPDKYRRKKYAPLRQGVHQLRHYYASTMLADGTSPMDLAMFLGHADAAFTLAVYTHPMDDANARAVALLDARLGRPRAVEAS
jgi:integrase